MTRAEARILAGLDPVEVRTKRYDQIMAQIGNAIRDKVQGITVDRIDPRTFEQLRKDQYILTSYGDGRIQIEW